VHRPVRARWLAGEPSVRAAMERLAEIGLAGKRALLEGDWPQLGGLMNRNHALVRDLGASGAPNEALIAAALAAGAPGAKLAGAGDGGTIVALWPFDDAAPLEAALRHAGAAALYRPRREPGVRIETAAAR
jgi:mevalonate kinase